MPTSKLTTYFFHDANLIVCKPDSKKQVRSESQFFVTKVGNVWMCCRLLTIAGHIHKCMIVRHLIRVFISNLHLIEKNPKRLNHLLNLVQLIKWSCQNTNPNLFNLRCASYLSYHTVWQLSALCTISEYFHVFPSLCLLLEQNKKMLSDSYIFCTCQKENSQTEAPSFDGTAEAHRCSWLCNMAQWLNLSEPYFITGKMEVVMATIQCQF